MFYDLPCSRFVRTIVLGGNNKVPMACLWRTQRLFIATEKERDSEGEIVRERYREGDIYIYEGYEEKSEHP